MANQLKIIGQAYKNFGLKHTSKSTATLPNSIRFFKKHCLDSKEASKLTNASLQGGTIVAELYRLGMIYKGDSNHRKIRMSDSQMSAVPKLKFNREYHTNV